MPQLNRTVSQILSRIITRGKQELPDLLWEQYQPLYDIVSTLSNEFSRITTLLEYVRRISRLSGYKEVPSSFITILADELELTEDQVTVLLEDDLDAYAEMYLVDRLQAREALGTFYLYFSDNNLVNANIGTRFKTAGGKVYTLAETLTNVQPVLVDGSYIVYAVLESDGVGTTYNIPSGIKINAESTIPKFLYGESAHHITTGRDKETNSHYVDRVRELRHARSVGSKTWIQRLLYTDNEVLDCVIYATGDNQFTRATTGADAWVYVVESPELNTDQVYETEHYFEKQPLTTNNPIVTSGISLIRDSSDNAYSVYSKDKAFIPAIQTTVTYRTDSTLRRLQLMMENKDNWIIGGRQTILVKRALEKPVDVHFTYNLVQGYDQTTVESNILADLVKFFTSGETTAGVYFERKDIGDSVDESDILENILSVDGVDNVDLDTFYIRRQDGQYIGKDPLPSDYNSYLTLGNVFITKGN